MIDILVVAHAPILGINRRIYRALARRGWSVELAIPEATPWRGPVAQPRLPEDPPIHTLPVSGRNVRFWRFLGIDKLITRRRPKILFLENEPDSRIACELSRTARETGARLICVTNENDLPPPLAALLAGQYKPALRSLRSRLWSMAARHYVDHVFAICEDGVRAMETLGFRGRVTKMPLGFDPELFVPFDATRRDEARQCLGLTKPAIAYVGRLAPNKGVHLLIEALGRLRDLDWQFLLDDFEQRDDAYAVRLRQALAEQGLADRTVYFQATHDEIPSILNAADIVVVPSTWKEQYGRVVPEAMACGRAVVVSDIGALPELLGDCGVKIPPGNVAALAAALRRLIGNPSEWARLGALASARAHAHLDLEVQADIIDRTLRGMANPA